MTEKKTFFLIRSKSKIGNETREAIQRLNMALRIVIENETRKLEKGASTNDVIISINNLPSNSKLKDLK